MSPEGLKSLYTIKLVTAVPASNERNNQNSGECQVLLSKLHLAEVLLKI